MSEQLKPCPFCGHTVIKTIVDDGCHWEQCQKCEATGPVGFKRGEEGDLEWNSRAVLAQPTTCTKDGGQGKPLAWLDLEKIQHGMAYATKMRVNHRQTAMYAKQPAPVSVMAPERKSITALGLTVLDSEAQGWNACLDDLKRLNPELFK